MCAVATGGASCPASGVAVPRGDGVGARTGIAVGAALATGTGIAVAAILSVIYPDASFAMMLSISMFGGMFTWLMIFVTHLFFRRRHAGETLAFRMWGYPYSSLAGAGLMMAALITTIFTREFRMTLLYGVPFLLVLAAIFSLRFRRAARPAEEVIQLPS